VLGRVGHPSLLTFTPSQKKHQETLDWGLRRGCQGSTLVWSLLPGCPPCLVSPSGLSFSWRQPFGGSGQSPPSEGEFTVPGTLASQTTQSNLMRGHPAPILGLAGGQLPGEVHCEGDFCS